MSEVLWWRKESWWEARSIPLFGFFVSPRQVAFVLGGGLLGLIASAFIPIYYGKVAAVLVLLFVGVGLAMVPVKTVPWELSLLYRLAKPRSAQAARKSIETKEAVPEVIAGSGVPFAIVGELRVEKPTEVVLMVDGNERARAVVAPDLPKYRLYYYPEESEKGAHDLVVVVEGKTIKSVKVNAA